MEDFEITVEETEAIEIKTEAEEEFTITTEQ